MELRDYLRALRKRWWLLPAAAAVAVGIAALVTYRMPPQYATSTTFFIGTSNHGLADAYQGSLFSQERAKSYAALLSSDRIAAAVSNEPAIGLSPDEVRRRITAQPIPQTVLLQATVTDKSKERSRLVANALAAKFTETIESLETPAAVDGQTAGAAGNSTVKVAIIAGPRLDPNPVSPQPIRNLGLAALFGLLAGAAISVLREMTDNSVQDSEALQELAGAPVLATIPHDSEASKAPLVSGRAGRAARAEALRQLRTNLQFVDVDRPVRVIVVTSAVPAEGKSSTAVNLAIVFAEAGQRVLIIDGDLRRPKLAEYLGIEGAVGLTNLLAGQAESDDVIQRWGPRLWALPSGFLPPNPSELLASKQMADLLQTVRERFDIVVIDSPPVLAVTDSAVLATSADGALLVVRASKTSSSQITGAVRALDTVNARLLGCALNMVPGMKDDDYYYRQDHRAALSHGQSRSESVTASASAVPLQTVIAAVDGAAQPASTVAATAEEPPATVKPVASAAPAR